MRIASLKYRLQLPGFELSEPVRLAQRAYDERSSRMLEEMADRIEGTATPAGQVPPDSSDLLEQTIEAYCTEESQQLPAAHVWSFTTLLRGIDRLTSSLAGEIAAEADLTNADLTNADLTE